jgi:hypothetical protein
MDELLDINMKSFTEWLKSQNESGATYGALDSVGPGSRDWKRDEEEMLHWDAVRARARKWKALKKKREAEEALARGETPKRSIWSRLGI